MANDDMVLNFNFSTIPVPIKNSSAPVKGGRWTQRLQAKRATKGRQQPVTKNDTQKSILTITEREAGQIHSPSSVNQSLKQEGADDKPPKGLPAAADGTFVSSLWTGNPEANTAPEKQQKEFQAQVPSNAPITDGSSTFTSLGLSPVLASHLVEKLSLKAPTAIQRSAIPQLLSEDSDAFIQAETGSGKTFTYLLPIVDRIMRISNPSGCSGRQSGLYAIILAPTRELSRQIYAVLQTVIHCKNGPHWIVAGLVIGGEKKKSEKARIRKGMNILVCTPGRLLDHLETTTSLHVDRIRWLVLDEGDRLMELGFEVSITKILEILNKHLRPNRPQPHDPMPSKRVTILCSATMKTNVQKLGEKSLRDALYIKSVKQETGNGRDTEVGQFSAPAQLRQSYIIIPAKIRLVGLNAVLQRAFIRPSANPKVVVFFSCTDSVDFHFEVFSRKEHTKSYLEDSKAPAIASAPRLGSNILIHKLHGSLPQLVRTSTLASFTKAKGPAILFCTDVAARGLDLPNLDLVVQFDPPFSPDDHLHRIGRTARAGREGRAVMFLLPGPEEGYVEAVLKKGIQEGQLVQLQYGEVIQKGFGHGRKEKRQEWEDQATEWHLQIERWVMENQKIKELASKAWGSHIRAYTTHVSEEKSIFNHKSLHYGHLAKSFGLRDKPTSIKLPISHRGQVGGAARNKLKGVDGIKRKFTAEDFREVAGEDGMGRMRKMARAMEKKGGMSSEFNIS